MLNHHHHQQFIAGDVDWEIVKCCRSVDALDQSTSCAYVVHMLHHQISDYYNPLQIHFFQFLDFKLNPTTLSEYCINHITQAKPLKCFLMTDTKIWSPFKFVALKVKQKNVINKFGLFSAAFLLLSFHLHFTIVYCEVQYDLVLRKRVSKKKET